ncbi:MAG: hypothetical protein QM756_10530 [Polyangiaceae bacterium]
MDREIRADRKAAKAKLKEEKKARAKIRIETHEMLIEFHTGVVAHARVTLDRLSWSCHYTVNTWPRSSATSFSSFG